MPESTVLGGAVFWIVPETGTYWRSLSERPEDVEVLATYPPERTVLAPFQGGRFNGSSSGPWSPGIMRCATRLMVLRALRAAGFLE